MMYLPKARKQLRTPVTLLKTGEIKKYNGVAYRENTIHADLVWANWKSYGGTETVVNGLTVIEETAQVTMRYRPDIKKGCQMQLPDGRTYEVMGEPENPDMANRYLIFKVKRIKGSA